jgi:hypothetical protein
VTVFLANNQRLVAGRLMPTAHFHGILDGGWQTGLEGDCMVAATTRGEAGGWERLMGQNEQVHRTSNPVGSKGQR